MNEQKKIITSALKDTLPIMAGYIVLGMGFGMILNSKGIGIRYSLLMSVFIYAGSMQFVAIDLLSAGASFATVALATLMVNCRHLFYGISVIDRYKGAGAYKPYLIFALTDETYSLIVADKFTGEGRFRYYFLISLLDHCYWVLGSLLGSLIGELLPINTEGMDFALTALFVTILADQWRSTKNHIPAIIGVTVSLAALLIFGADNFLIPAMLIISILLICIRKWEEPKYE